MSLKTRIERAEKITKPSRTAYFVIADGKASGGYWWTSDKQVKWKDLNQVQYDDVTEKLREDGAEIFALNMTCVYPDGRKVDGWTKHEPLTPEQLIEIYDNQKMVEVESCK